MKKLLSLAIALFFTSTVFAQDSLSLKKYLGTYAIQDGGPITELIISIEDGGLYGAVPGQGEAALKATETPNEFAIMGYDGKVKFIEEDGFFVAVEMSVQGNELTGIREFPSLTDFEGTYNFEGATIEKMIVTVEDDALMAEVEGMGKAEITKTSILDEFTEANYNSQIVFKRDEKGVVMGISIFAQGQEMVGTKE